MEGLQSYQILLIADQLPLLFEIATDWVILFIHVRLERLFICF